MVLTYGYIAIFLLSFTSLFRSRLPLHRLLADLWATARMEKTAERIRSRMGSLPKLKPKHDRQASPEHQREWEEMKLRRGDLDATPPPESAGFDTEENKVVKPAQPPAAAPAPAPKKDAKKQEKKADEAKATANAKSDTPPEDAKTKTSTPEAQESKPHENADKSAKDNSADEDARNLERMILRRFTNDVIRPATSAMPDDPVTRRGGALALAGAASALEATSQRGPDSNVTLLREISSVEDIAPYLTEAFLEHFNEHLAEEDNSPVVAADRRTMTSYLAGETQLVRAIAAVLSEWRTPFAQPPGTLPENVAYTSRDLTTKLLGVYVLTEVRHRAPTESETANETLIEAAHDAAMGMHNTIVRAAVGTHNGNEITHTGKGIFAHFDSPDEALDAATDIQRQFTKNGGAAVAIVVIGNFYADEDPNYSPALSRHAQTMVAKADGGEILCEPGVHNAAESPRGVPAKKTTDDEADGGTEPLIHIAVETISPKVDETARVG